MKIGFDHLGSGKNSGKLKFLDFYNFLENIIKDKCEATIFSFLLILSLYLFGMEQIISNIWTSISLSTSGDGSNGAQQTS